MNSVLLIGDDSFTASVITQVRGLDALTVKMVATAVAALKLIEEFAPDVAIVQARQLINSSIFQTFAHERHNTYFVVIEESTLYALYATEDSALASALGRSFVDLYLERTAGAIESGADAYLWLPPPHAAALPTALLSASSVESASSGEAICATQDIAKKSPFN